MEQLDLDTAFSTNGIPHISFWNGRILTAEDLRDEQLANALGRGRLGRAIGAGVVSGFDVRSSTDTTVVVTAGLAVDAFGQVVELPVDVELSLVVPPDPAGGDGVFTVCEAIVSSSPTGTGVYVLVARQASSDSDQASGVAAFGNGTATECGPKYSIDGTSFRLIHVDAQALAGAVGHDQDDLDVLATLGTVAELGAARNVLAHLFLDTVPWSHRFAAPFTVPASSTSLGTMDVLGSTKLPCEVPIALLTWSFDDLGFVDVWSVRRPLASDHALDVISFLATREREAIGRAVFSQFADQLGSIASSLNVAQREVFVLRDRFRYLPAAGLIPIQRSDQVGFAPTVFGDLVVRGPAAIDPERVRAILDESFHHAPIDLTRGEVVFVYHVLDGNGDVDHMVFCTSRMDYLADELVIDAVFPAGMLALGQQIEIRGRNFGFTTGDARIRFDGIAANARNGSTDSRLRVRVPLNLAVDPAGTEVRLEVTSNAGDDAVPIVVGFPELEPVGNLNLEWLAVDPETTLATQPATVSYRLRSTVSPSVDVELLLDGTQEALDQATLVDDAGTGITAPIRMAVDDEIDIAVELAAVPNIASFSLDLVARVVGHPEIEGADGRTIVVGEAVPPSDPEITILTPPDVSTQPGTGTASLAGSTLSVGDGAIVDLEFSVRVTQPGRYLVRVEPESFVAPWLSVLSAPSSGEVAVVTPAEVADDGQAFREVRVTVGRESAAAPPPSAVTLIVNRPGRTDDARVTYQLAGS